MISFFSRLARFHPIFSKEAETIPKPAAVAETSRRKPNEKMTDKTATQYAETKSKTKNKWHTHTHTRGNREDEREEKYIASNQKTNGD